MTWNLIKVFEGFNNYNIVAWDKGIEIGYLIFYPSPNHLRIIPIDNLDLSRDKIFTGNNSFYYIIGESLYVNIDNQLYGFDFELRRENLICETKEDRIKILNKYCSLGSTNSRKPRINRNVIIRNVDCSIAYSWDNKSYIVGQLEDSVFLFQSFEDDKLVCFDVESGQEFWSKGFKKRIGPGRLYLIIEGKIVTQESNANESADLICIENKLGSLLWKVENALSFYNFDESNCKLYGLGGNTFEVINADTGERELQKELGEELHIASHLTYYANSLLYFSGYRDNNIPVFGAVNVEDGSLVFTQEVEMPGEKSFRKGLDRPVVVGNRLYVRDAMKTLHIFEKEKL